MSNRYQVPAELVGRHIELRFDPEDLSRLEVYLDGAPAGVATPFSIGRHVHPAVPQAAPEPPPEEPGVDYLGLVAAAHAEALGEASISYRSLHLPGMEGPSDEAAS